MLDFLIFAATFLIVLVIAVVYLYPGSRKATTIPGLDPSHPRDGNLADVRDADSLHEFLVKLHGDHGDLASFWLGQQLIVSTASPELFESQANNFDRPKDLFEAYESLLGADSILYCNGGAARKRRQAHQAAFSTKVLEAQCRLFHKCAVEMRAKWMQMSSGEHIPLRSYMLALSIKALLQSTCGNYFQEDNKVIDFKKNFDVCWSELEALSKDNTMGVDSEKDTKFNECKAKLVEHLEKAIKVRGKDGMLIDIIQETDSPQSVKVADLLTYITLGFHSTGLLLTWTIYRIASDEKIQEKLLKELKSLGSDKGISVNDIKKLKYLRQVIQESLRMSNLCPYTARVLDIDIELNKHKVPAKTPIIQALGVVQHSDEVWSMPNAFDPGNFSEDRENKPAKHSFEPFGFAGKRNCPAVEFVYTLTSICICMLLKSLKISVIEGQVIQPDYSGLVTSPREEIWISVEKRT